MTHGETVDWAYFQFGTIGFTPELDTAATGRRDRQLVRLPRRRGQGPGGLPEEPPPGAEPGQLGDAPGPPVATTRRTRREYQIKPTLDIQPTSSTSPTAAPQIVEAIVRRSLGPVDISATISGPGGTSRSQSAARERRTPAASATATCPASTSGASARRCPRTGTPRPRRASRRAGDTVAVTVRAGGLQQRFSYRIASTQPDKTKKRVLVIAAEDYTGTSPNRKPPLRDRAALPAAARRRAQGRGLRGRHVQHRRPPLNASGVAGQVPDVPRRALALRRRRLLHGRRLRPAGARATNPRYLERGDRASAARR